LQQDCQWLPKSEKSEIPYRRSAIRNCFHIIYWSSGRPVAERCAKSTIRNPKSAMPEGSPYRLLLLLEMASVLAA
jgi:hypothetical protein